MMRDDYNYRFKLTDYTQLDRNRKRKVAVYGRVSTEHEAQIAVDEFLPRALVAGLDAQHQLAHLPGGQHGQLCRIDAADFNLVHVPSDLP